MAVLYDSYQLNESEWAAIKHTNLIGELMKHKLTLVGSTEEIANIHEVINEKINSIWYMEEGTESVNDKIMRLYFTTLTAKDIAKGIINAEISGKGLTG